MNRNTGVDFQQQHSDVINQQMLHRLNDEPSALEPLLSVKEAARILHLSEKTLRDWVWRRKIEYVKVGGRVMFTPAVLRAFINGGTVRVQ